MRGTLLESVDAVLDKAIREKHFVGAVVLASLAGRSVYERVVGFADRDARTLVRLSTVFWWTSLTKLVWMPETEDPDLGRFGAFMRDQARRTDCSNFRAVHSTTGASPMNAMSSHRRSSIAGLPVSVFALGLSVF